MFHDASAHGFRGQASGEIYLGYDTWAFLVAQRVKNLPAIWKTWVQSLGWEDPLEKAMATHSSIHACRIPWTEEPGRLRSMGSQRVGLTEQFKDNKQAEILGDQQGEL